MSVPREKAQALSITEIIPQTILIYFNVSQSKPCVKIQIVGGQKAMKILFSIIILAVLGVGGYFGYNQFINHPDTPIVLNLPSSVSPRVPGFDLQINNPDDELLVFSKSLTVSGQTSPNATVMFTNGDSDSAVSASSSGSFTQVLNLNPGLNTITINAFDSIGEAKTVTRTVYFSEDQLL